MRHQRIGFGLALAVTLAGCGQFTPAASPSSEAMFASSGMVDRLLSITNRQSRKGFDAYDPDRDGRVKHQDVPFLFPKTFKRLDKNGDGFLTYAEAKPEPGRLKGAVKQLSGMLTATFKQLDLNSDGLLDPQELVGRDGMLDAAQRAPLTPEAFLVALERDHQSLEAEASLQANDKNPILGVPGFFLPAFIWVDLRRDLAKQGWNRFYTMEHWPGFDDIREYAAEAKLHVERIKRETGTRQVEYFGHSMGGLVGRYMIKSLGAEKDVAHYVAFGTPQHGTVVAHLFNWIITSNKQMSRGSAFLKELNAGDETPGRVKYTMIRGGLDEISIPNDTAVLDGADNHFIPRAMHLHLVFHPEAQRIAIEALKK
jgi:triacylglycerol lipase